MTGAERHEAQRLADDTRWYSLNGVSHRIDRRATNARGGGGILTRCGVDLRFYAVTGTPRGTMCPTCDLADEQVLAAGQDPVYEDEFTGSVDEAVDLLVGQTADAVTRTAMRKRVVEARQAVCRHEGRVYDDEAADGRTVTICSQCDAELMAEENEDGVTFEAVP